MYYVSLKPNQKVDIYLNCKSDDPVFEAEAILIKKEEVGLSYSLDYEQLEYPPTLKSSLHKSDPKVDEMRQIHDYLHSYLGEDQKNKKIIAFREQLHKLCNRKRESYNNMYRCVEDWKKRYEDTPHSINNIFEVPTKYIVRYIQQKKIKNWRPTLFVAERWLIETTSDDPFHIPFRTHRWIPVLLRISPREELNIRKERRKKKRRLAKKRKKKAKKKIAIRRDSLQRGVDCFSDAF